jgi:hypothetical protein
MGVQGMIEEKSRCWTGIGTDKCDPKNWSRDYMSWRRSLYGFIREIMALKQKKKITRIIKGYHGV